MNILVATGIFPPDAGGPASYVPRIARALVSRGHRVTVVTLTDGRPSDGPGHPFPVVRIRRRSPLPWRVLRTTAALIRLGRRADLLYANGLYLEAALASTLLRKPLVAKVVGDWVWERACNRHVTTDGFQAFQAHRHSVSLEIAKRVRDSCLRRAARVIVPSRFLAEVVVRWGVPAAVVHVVHNTVEPIEARPTTPIPLTTRHRLVAIGRLVPWKGIDGLLHVLGALSPEIGLVVVGEGPARRRLEHLAIELGIRERVYFTGQLEPPEVAGVLARCDALVLNSGYEGLPHVVLEAMQGGIPVIATRVGGVEELVQDGRVGLLVPSGDRAALELAVATLLAEPARRLAMGREGQTVARERFGLPAMVEATEGVLRHALPASRERPRATTEPDRPPRAAGTGVDRSPERPCVCFVTSTRYAEPLDASQAKKWRSLTPLGRLLVVGFSGGWRPRRFVHDATFYLLPTPPLAPLRYLVAAVGGTALAAWLVIRHRVDILVAQSPYTGCLGAVAAALGGALGRRPALVVESHGDFEESVFLHRQVRLPRLQRAFMGFTARFALRRATALRAVSRATEQQLTRHASGKPIVRFPAWTDLDTFVAAGKGAPARACTVLYAGVLTPLKGVHVLLEAFEQVGAAMPGARLSLIGAPANPSYARDLARQAARSLLAPRIELVGEVSQAELARRMASALVLVLPSRVEGLGRVLLEAMVAGAVVIATRVGGIPEVVEDGVTGFLVPPDDVSALAARLLWVLRHPADLDDMRERARESVGRLYSTRIYVEAYGELFARARARPPMATPVLEDEG